MLFLCIVATADESIEWALVSVEIFASANSKTTTDWYSYEIRWFVRWLISP